MFEDSLMTVEFLARQLHVSTESVYNVLHAIVHMGKVLQAGFEGLLTPFQSNNL